MIIIRKHFKELYEAFKNIQQENMSYQIWNLLEGRAYQVKDILDLLDERGTNYIHFYNNLWDFYITKTTPPSISIEDKERNQNYSSKNPENNYSVLEKFLEYYVKKFSEKDLSYY